MNKLSITLYMEKHQVKAIKALHEKTKIPMSVLYRTAVEEYLDRHKYKLEEPEVEEPEDNEPEIGKLNIEEF